MNPAVHPAEYIRSRRTPQSDHQHRHWTYEVSQSESGERAKWPEQQEHIITVPDQPTEDVRPEETRSELEGTPIQTKWVLLPREQTDDSQRCYQSSLAYQRHRTVTASKSRGHRWSTTRYTRRLPHWHCKIGLIRRGILASHPLK